MLQKSLAYLVFLFLLIGYPGVCHATAVSPLLTVDLDNANLPDALRLIAKQIQHDIVVSPSVNGAVTLHLQQADPEQAFDLILASQGLAKYTAGSIWFVAPQAELLRRAQEMAKLQTVLHAAEPLATRLWQIQYAKADDIAHVLQDNHHTLLSPRGHLQVDARTNIVCVHDVAAQFSDMNAVIQRLDIPVQQVEIQARLASVDSGTEQELGIHFDMQGSDALPASQHFNVAVVKLPNASLLDVQLAALEHAGHGELISSPRLFTANQQTAYIESGEEIPYQETSNNGATSVVFKKAVLSLKVTPQVMPDNKVMLHLRVTQDKPSHRDVLGVPSINTRQITTNILLKSGQTVVLGGIYESDHEYGEQQIPFLGKIPLVGLLFQQHNSLTSKRQLLIFVTPKIKTIEHDQT